MHKGPEKLSTELARLEQGVILPEAQMLFAVWQNRLDPANLVHQERTRALAKDPEAVARLLQIALYNPGILTVSASTDRPSTNITVIRQRFPNLLAFFTDDRLKPGFEKLPYFEERIKDDRRLLQETVPNLTMPETSALTMRRLADDCYLDALNPESRFKIFFSHEMYVFMVEEGFENPNSPPALEGESERFIALGQRLGILRRLYDLRIDTKVLGPLERISGLQVQIQVLGTLAEASDPKSDLQKRYRAEARELTEQLNQARRRYAEWTQKVGAEDFRSAAEFRHQTNE